MRIVYDKTQTMEKGLAGWSGPAPDFFSDSGLSATDKALWHRLVPGQFPLVGQLRVSSPSLDFWDQLYLVDDAQESQYDVLRQAPSEPNQRFACVALKGSGFHGQRQRSWEALDGNLHLSISIPLNLSPGVEALAWTMLPAVAMVRAMPVLGLSDLDDWGIKWINDVLVGGDKVGGAISSLIVSGGRVKRGFLGIGLNVGQGPKLTVPTSCLNHHLLGQEIPLGRVLQVVLGCVADLTMMLENGQNEVIAQEYRQHCLVLGRQVRLMTDPMEGPVEEICRGKVLEVLGDLGLVVEGQQEPVRHGRLSFLE